MKRFLLMLCSVIAMGSAMSQQSFFDFAVKAQDGSDVKLADYKGQYILVVNTAIKCGFTPQYQELQNMYEKFHGDGFVILDFPCNQFGAQAPGSNEEIHNFCTANFHTTFPQFDKIDVNGPKADPLFVWLKKQKKFEGFDLSTPLGQGLDKMLEEQDPNFRNNADIKWNFTKFLINPDGKVVERFEPTVDMQKVMDIVYEYIYGGKK